MITAKIIRGTKRQHQRLGAKDIQAGDFSLVTDSPEIRFHDGITAGGISIPISESTHKSIMGVYYPQETFPLPKPSKKSWLEKLFRL